SVGLAKAALEAINGFNLFGNQNTDAALLPCISYPAFALDDEALFSQTLDKLFDGIECEFPIFFLYMMIDGYPVIPKYYYVPADFVEYEKRNPGSQKRFPSNCGRDGKLFLWGQALYIIAKLLVDELISPMDIDPVQRYVPLQNQRNVSMRFSNQKDLSGVRSNLEEQTEKQQPKGKRGPKKQQEKSSCRGRGDDSSNLRKKEGNLQQPPSEES
ncbi:Phosphorylase b kinase regulatory subunit beta, partial [Galemys pyrenaicus]